MKTVFVCVLFGLTLIANVVGLVAGVLVFRPILFSQQSPAAASVVVLAVALFIIVTFFVVSSIAIRFQTASRTLAIIFVVVEGCLLPFALLFTLFGSIYGDRAA